MALKFDKYLGPWGRYSQAPSGSFKCTAGGKVYVVINSSVGDYSLHVRDLKPGKTFLRIGSFSSAAKAKQAIKLLAK